MSVWEKEGESGLLDNFEFTITSAYFATHEKYMGNQVLLLNWEGTTDSLDVPVMHVWYSMGGGWITKDGGASIVHESGDPEKWFNKSTQYYRIIARCRDDFKITPLLEKRGDPFHAATWVGLKFRLKNEPQRGVGGAEGKDKQMPIEFLGEVSSNGSSAGTATSSGEESPQAKMARLKAERTAAMNAEADAQGLPAGDSQPATLRDQAIAILKAEDDFEVAQAKCLDLDGIMDDDDLMQSLMEADGLFADVKAGKVSA